MTIIKDLDLDAAVRIATPTQSAAGASAGLA